MVLRIRPSDQMEIEELNINLDSHQYRKQCSSQVAAHPSSWASSTRRTKFRKPLWTEEEK